MRKLQSSRCRLLLVGAALTLATWVVAQPAKPGTSLHDIDHDGVEEKLISRPGLNEIQR